MVGVVARQFRLTGVAVDGSAIDLELPPGESTVGRDASADLRLDDPRVSRAHAALRLTPDGLTVRDLGSTNGTLVNGERVTETELQPGDQLSFGGLTVQVVGDPPPVPAAGADATQVFAAVQPQVAAGNDGTVILEPGFAGSNATRVLAPVEAPAPVARERGVVSDDMLLEPIISEQDLIANGVDVLVVPCAGVGGGMGSFVWADLLRVSGVPADQIAVVGNEAHPYTRYQRLCQNSQIPGPERLRSNSDSCPDNPWGFPGYAAREAWGELKRGRLLRALGLYWQILGEPALTVTYTPRSGDVFASIDKEEARIGWPGIIRFGRVRAIRKTHEGRLVVVASASDERGRRHFAVSAQFLHMSIGYPSIQLLPDLADYREKYEDQTRVINAYEEHSHVYNALREKGGTVLLRGRGIVASRIIQRIYEERQKGAKIAIVHLHRSRLTQGHRWRYGRRTVENEFEFQPFNWPKSAWSGEQRGLLEQASPDERKQLLEAWGGTTTADRRDWKRMVAEGIRDGWYRPEYGTVKDMTPRDGRVISHIGNSLAGGGILELAADFIIDCTGLIASPDRAPLVADMLKTYGLPKNPYGRLAVTNDFEIAGMRHGAARMYAAGAITLGNSMAAVDSFLGLQYCAYRTVHHMQRHAPQHIRKLKGFYSFRQWLRWRRGVAP